MNKKAQQTDLTHIILVLIIGAILLLFVGGSFVPWSKIFGEENACKLSILAAAKTSKDFKVLKTDPLFNLECPVQDKVIKFKDFSKNGKVDSEKVKLEIAKEMYKCWDKVGQGKLDPFGDWKGDPTYCLICSTIRFDEEFQNNADDPKASNAPLMGFSQYLGKKYVPGKDYTFYQYLYGQSMSNEITPEIQSQLSTIDYIDYKKSQTIIWRAEVDGHSPWIITSSIGGVALAAGVIAVSLALIPVTAGTSAIYMTTLVTMSSVGNALGATGLLSSAIVGFTVSGIVGGGVGYLLADGRTVNMELFLMPTELIDSKIAEGSNKDERFCEILVN